MAVAHGNRTHRGRLSAPATGFEDRASHQIRKRYRLVLTLKLRQTDNILWVWCRAGAIEMHEPSVGEERGSTGRDRRLYLVPCDPRQRFRDLGKHGLKVQAVGVAALTYGGQIPANGLLRKDTSRAAYVDRRLLPEHQEQKGRVCMALLRCSHHERVLAGQLLGLEGACPDALRLAEHIAMGRRADCV